jgi:hypothetical protein
LSNKARIRRAPDALNKEKLAMKQLNQSELLSVTGGRALSFSSGGGQASVRTPTRTFSDRQVEQISMIVAGVPSIAGTAVVTTSCSGGSLGTATPFCVVVGAAAGLAIQSLIQPYVSEVLKEAMDDKGGTSLSVYGDGSLQLDWDTAPNEHEIQEIRNAWERAWESGALNAMSIGEAIQSASRNLIREANMEGQREFY